MRVLNSFNKSIARPKTDKANLLTIHLINTKNYAEKRLNEADPIVKKMMGLAGLCHDVAKANYKWQQYINSLKAHGPTHAPDSAFLFSYIAYKLLNKINAWAGYKGVWLRLIRDIADHHGELKGLFDCSFMGAGDWSHVDLNGFSIFIKDFYPELADLVIDEEALEAWIDEIDLYYEDARESFYLDYNQPNCLQLMTSMQKWRELTTSLVAGDRFDVAYVTNNVFSESMLKKNDSCIDKFCHANRNHHLSSVRMQAQQDVLLQLGKNPSAVFYSLEMPTGYGKSITSLKIANWLGINKGYSKIIYVAPYISILEQTSEVVENVMQTPAMEHHSLALFKASEDKNIPQSHLAIETWANAVVCTSFQQFSKALFPKRAQDVLRRAYLRKSVIIIDEPQIFDPSGWNIFLCGLESLANIYDLRIIFLSATMPTFEYGLSVAPVRLQITNKEKIDRYKVVIHNSMDEKSITNYLISKSKKKQAVILNTIEDAYRVYKELAERINNVYLLHGMMIPLHKQIYINKLKKWLKCSNKPITVVSTQVIEAGVDVSFEHVVRALAILPSIVQAAGRVNRHAENNLATVSVFKFLRNGEKDTRNSIYSKSLLRITDKLLKTQATWTETEIMKLIKVYYKEMFRANTYEASKQKIVEAFEGNWPALASYQPFKDNSYRLPVFVPWEISEQDKDFLPERLLRLQHITGITSPKDLYDHYQNKSFMASLTYEKRKMFMVHFNYYVLNVPINLAFQLVGKDEYLFVKVPKIIDHSDYDSQTGIARRKVEGFDNIL